MIDLNKIKEIYIYPGATDLRLGINGLTNLIHSTIDSTDLTGMLFVFCGKNKKCLKVVEYEDAGVWLYQKRLFKGIHTFPERGVTTKISKQDLDILINGLNFVHKIEGHSYIRYDNI